ncbi:hypothetical protein DCAR_0831219 [Daucus carota subsp. sativus]|uniref:Uncharacterized protein n=1 Tax=Daucus carota subsp. sativus TaxID=79200 RepID=A0AAF0XPB6_DAUCS|nr:hypothetical protein DCAR_0831219 [Daucus carota subsp. sativus]
MINHMINKSCGYSKMEREDPGEIQHRRAQFLIYKVLQQAATGSPKRRKLSHLRLRTHRLKIRIGKTLKKLKKKIFSAIKLLK